MSSSPGVVPDRVRAELQAILASHALAASERQRRFLSFVVEETLNGRAEGVKESVIALEVFGRDSSFDPRIDSIVRVEARNLRLRLAAYYQKEGASDEVLVDVPRGSYVPTFATRQAAPEIPARSTRWRALALAGPVLAVLAVATWWVVRSRTPNFPLPSIAVLPFLNLGGGPANDYMADGFVEDLTTDLARLPGLRVAARTSAFQFRGRNEDMRAIGKHLGVVSVLEGSIRMDPGRLRVTAQLISAQTGFHIWSTAYDKTVASLPEAQSAIARAVAETFTLRGDSAAPRRHTPPAGALDAYWRGRYLRARPQSRAEGLRFLEGAVVSDPQFAEAWAALASTYAIMSFHAEMPLEQGAAKARQAALRSLSLDDSIAEAHAALAQLAYSYDHDFPAAERSYIRAVSLNPSAAGTHRGFALALVSQSRFDEALRRLDFARQVDPLSLQTGNDLATAYYCARRYADAIRTARQRLSTEPDYAPAWIVTGSSLALSGRPRDGAAALEKAAAQDRNLTVLSRLAHAQALAGRTAEARVLLKEIAGAGGTAAGSGVAAAIVHMGLGEHDKAMEALQRAFDAREADTTFLAVEPIFAPLHSQPAFRALCARLRLPLL